MAADFQQGPLPKPLGKGEGGPTQFLAGCQGERWEEMRKVWGFFTTLHSVPLGRSGGLSEPVCFHLQCSAPTLQADLLEG